MESKGLRQQTSQHEEVGRVIARTERDIVRIYLDMIRRVLEHLPLLNMGVVRGDGVEWESLQKHPRFRRELQREVERMRDGWKRRISEGMERGWACGEEEADDLTKGYFRGHREVPESLRESYLVRTDEARRAYLRRGDKGLSRRIWREGERVQRHLEDSISEALSEGVPATELSRKIREDLKHPDKLFRRVRNKYGELVLSRSARAFHPGQGVYRSSYKNAMRVARTEINSAYRTADHERWQRMDFVKGIRISLSNNHTCNGVPFTDICDDLKGVYPKGFKFTGWHPQCRCIATTVLEDFEGFIDRKLRGGKAPEGVTELPDNFKQWAEKNAKRIEGAMERGATPYWLRDNQKLISRHLYKDVAEKISKGREPFQPHTYASFEPFSPAIIEAVRKAKDRKEKNAIFESVLNDARATVLYSIGSAKTTLYPNHKGCKSKYWPETKEMAKALNEKGVSVCFLPEMDETSSADALLKIGNKKWAIADFKYSGTTNSNTLATQLLKGFRQSEGGCVLKMAQGNLGTFREAIEECKRKGYVRGLFIINKYDKVVSVSVKELLSGKYERTLKGFF